jgi:hypothetical protein
VEEARHANILNTPFTVEEVMEGLKRMQLGKSA